MADQPKKICEACGKIHVTPKGNVACKAHLSDRSEQLTPCSRDPIRGGFVCRSHGGAIKATQVAAQERLALMSAQGEIANLMRECDIPEQHPIDGLLEVVRVSGSMMRLLTIKVGELAEEPVIHEVLEETDNSIEIRRVTDGEAFWGLNAREEMAPSIFVGMLHQWTERYERACKTALDAGIEERRIQLAEDTSETFFLALGKAVQSAGLDPATRAALNTALAAELRKNSAAVIDLI